MIRRSSQMAAQGSRKPEAAHPREPTGQPWETRAQVKNVVTAGGQTQGQTAGEQETIEENDVPRGRQPENDERGTNRDTQEIEADETPLSNKEGKADKDLKSYVIGGGAVVILRLQDCCFIQENTDCDKRNREMF